MSKIDFDLLSNYLIGKAVDVESFKKIVTHKNIIDTDKRGDGIITHMLWHFKDNSDIATLIHYCSDMGASLQICSGAEKFSLLHYAAYNRMPISTRKLLDLGIPVDIVDADERTPLHIAFQYNYFVNNPSHGSARVLLDAGAQLSLISISSHGKKIYPGAHIIPQWAHDFVDHRNTLRNASVIILGLKRCNSNTINSSKNGVDVLQIIARCVWESRGINMKIDENQHGN